MSINYCRLKLNSIYKYALIVVLLTSPFCGKGLGVLSHEAIIDAAWDKFIVPLLKFKYPATTDEQLVEAHAYAYGGAVSPDMGYYPFGSKQFTNLVHYVRSGDMVVALLNDAENVNQLAFALGFLSHYEADNYGHPLATNRSVTLVYKRLRKKYGKVITYEQNKIGHIRMEFGFDVLQTSKGNYASESYHNFIGFKIDTVVLAKAFLETYGLDINATFKHHFHFAVELFRFTIANLFPFITKTAWAGKNKNKLESDKSSTSKRFRYKMHVKQYNQQFGKDYVRPGFFPTVMAFFIKVLPKVGPLRALHFKIPTQQAEAYFDQSFDTIQVHFGINTFLLKKHNIRLEDIDFDTGKPAEHCEYQLADATYGNWLVDLQDNNFSNISTPIKKNILGYFNWKDSTSPGVCSKQCKKIVCAYNQIKILQIN